MNKPSRFTTTNKRITLIAVLAVVFALCLVCVASCELFFPVTLTGITAEYTGGDVEVGGTLYKDDVAVTAHYSNQTSKTVYVFDLGYDFSTAGQREVTVTYGGEANRKTFKFTVNVVEPEPPKPVVTLASITAVYSGENVKVGGVLNNADITVTATYSDETTKTVTNFTVGVFSSAAAGTQTVNISYTEGEITKDCTVDVTVVDDSPIVVSNSNVSVHFLELGNKYVGDSVYIKAGEKDILIDAGSRENSAGTIYNYISKYVTDGKLEYVIATHAHQDHIAGFVGTSTYPGIFDKFAVDTIIDFALTNQSLKTAAGNDTLYAKYLNKRATAINKGANHYTAAECFNESVEGAKRVYELGDDITLEILYNNYYFQNSGDENNYSVICILHQGDNHYFFSGDLEKEGEEKLVDYYINNNNPLPHCVLYKAGHHGSKTSSTAKLMAAISPEYVCVCCCAGTSEYTATSANQFPTQDFINRVAPYTDKVYVTTMADNYVSTGWGSNGTVKSMNGNIVFSCVSGEISLNCSNNNLKLKDTDWFKENRDCPEKWLPKSD